jgi:hypothetical protein
MIMKINSFDIDGVIYFGESTTGVRPGKDDIIITGRPFADREATVKMLESRGIYNTLYMNPLERKLKNHKVTHGVKENPLYGRKASGIFKGQMINMLKDLGVEIEMHFEDDPIQIKEIKKRCPDISIVHLKRDNEERVKY